ncbi:hypothetical protein D9757_013826 [Collybiopsis confluens]|uniref:ATP-dependent RNA helicase n=1 Tax=Collybiopsis confluens TaxID=2823264 RepID=A0A8H5FSF4_9AGAR|nr:hypothetical protein D9757_013826 [Collybiopsis confluens]
MTAMLFARAFGTTSTLQASKVAAQFAVRFSRSNSTAASSSSSQSSSHDVEPATGRSFSSLKGVISNETYNALVGDMKLQNMTSVQEEVLSLLPEIAEPYDPKTVVTESSPPRDLLVRAKTGTGKTVAFLIPAIEARLKAAEKAGKQALLDAGLMNDRNLERRAREKFQKDTVGALIISPTRELATQTANEAIKVLRYHKDLNVSLFTGGINKRLQMRTWMKSSRDIVVATTGRLRDLLNSEPDVLKSIRGTQTFILDEADTMLDMGFRDDIHAIQQELAPSPQRQTFLFSATVSPVIKQVSKSVLSPNMKYIDCVKSDDSPVHAHVPQYHTVLPNAAAQIPHILRLIAHDQLTNPKSRIVLFLPTTRMTQLFSTIVRELSQALPRRPQIYEIHSKRTMDSRVSASDRFRKDKSPASILITSDVSARGVDYPGVTRVIQVGIPSSSDQYIHRVGRTGRQGSISGRGDLVLLPWEIGFLTWQLTDVPIKPLTTGELQTQLEELSTKIDSGEITMDLHGMRTPLVPRISEYDNAHLEILPRFEEDAIKETFMSMLGYYFARSSDLRVTKNVILAGCKDWSTGAGGLEVPPYVSEAFLNKLGFGDGKYSTKNYGMQSNNRRDFRKPIWEARGSIRQARTEKQEWIKGGQSGFSSRDQVWSPGDDRRRSQGSGGDHRTPSRSQPWSSGGDRRTPSRSQPWSSGGDRRTPSRGSDREYPARNQSWSRNNGSDGGRSAASY